MKYNFPKLPLILSIVFLTISCSSVVFLFFKIKDTETTSTQILGEWQTENQRINEMKSLDNSIKSISQEKTLLDAHFVQSSNVVPFLNMIESLAPQVGGKAEVILVDESKDNTKLMVKVRASGSFESIYKFLTLLENSPYELKFTSMDIQKTLSAGTNDINNKEILTPQWSAILEVELLSFIQ